MNTLEGGSVELLAARGEARDGGDVVAPDEKHDHEAPDGPENGV